MQRAKFLVFVYTDLETGKDVMKLGRVRASLLLRISLRAEGCRLVGARVDFRRKVEAGAQGKKYKKVFRKSGGNVSKSPV